MIATLAMVGCGLPPDTSVRSGRVTAVLDGDTIAVAGVGTVRYLGIDTPELHHPRKPVERFAVRAAAMNRQLVAGRTVRLETDVKVERRGASGDDTSTPAALGSRVAVRDRTTGVGAAHRAVTSAI
jgi:endonuclease YncB( thermonuclease family)